MTYLLTSRLGSQTYYYHPDAPQGRVWATRPEDAHQYATLEAAKDARALMVNARGVLVMVSTVPAPRPEPGARRRPGPFPTETGPWYVICARQGERCILSTHTTRERAVRARDRLAVMEDCILTVEGALACSY